MSSSTPSESMTVTRALAELKHLNKVIEKKTVTGEYTKLLTNDNRKSVDVNQFQLQAKSDYQSLIDTLERYNRLKQAIVQSNANTQVTLGNKLYTVADVIERRSSLNFQKAVLANLRAQRERVLRDSEQYKQKIENNLNNMLEKSASAGKKDDSVEAMSKGYREMNKSEILDPLDLNKAISNLDTYILQFDHEANFTLSESNATTKLTF
jgi:hypothetical protein